MAFYDRYAFLEYFDSESILDKEVDIVEYVLKTNNGFVLFFFISPHEGTVILTLKSVEDGFDAYSIALYNLDKISYDNKKAEEIRILFYIPDDEIPAATLMLKPYVSLHMSVRLNKGGLL